MEINDYPNYLIYEDGRVWSKTSNKFLKQRSNTKGKYLYVNLYNPKRKTLKIHRLIALHFIPNPNNKPTVDHINRIRTDNRIENLRWATRQEQTDNRDFCSNTNEKYISKMTNGTNYYYNIYRKNYFQEYLNCSKYTLQDAINLRDSLLSIEDNIVEPSV